MTGTLGLFSLVDLFQLLASSSRTGRLRIQHPIGKARVYFDKGRVVHAEFDEMVGEEAVFALFRDEQGNFEFTVGLPAPLVSVESNTENLILEAIRRLDEARREEPQDAVPRDSVPVVVEENLSRFTLQHDEQAVLQRINGARNVTQIALDAGVEPEVAMEVVGRLLKVGTVKIRGKRARTARLVTRLTDATLPADSVGLDQGILTTWERAIGYPPRQVACRLPDGRVNVFDARAVHGAGPYIHFSRDALFRANLAVDVILLVRPVLRAE